MFKGLADVWSDHESEAVCMKRMDVGPNKRGNLCSVFLWQYPSHAWLSER